MKSYKKHLISTKSIGEKVDLKRKPIYRGSAIFTVISNSDLETRILFMGYWIVKNNINELGLLITLRNQKGNIIYRKTDQIITASAREINIRDFLKEANYLDEDFIGSIELEIFSCRDLVFPYPAFVVNYYNEYGSSMVHTTGRIYNDIEDHKNNEEFLVKECGFDIFPGADCEPFFTFVNGWADYEEAPVTIEIITGKGVVYEGEIDLGEIKPLETKLIKIKDYVSIDHFLNGQVGTIKIGHNLTGFFPRFIAGNFSRSTGALSITHTYYDNSDNISHSAYWENENSDVIQDASVFVPLFIVDDWYTQLKLYPIYSPSEHTVNIQFFDQSGKVIETVENFKLISEDFSEFIELDFGDLIDQLDLSRTEIKGAKLIKEWRDQSKIPTRLKYGLNVGKLNKEFNLPTNICFGSQISDIKIIDKKGTFKWFPLLNHGDSIAVIENSSFVKNYNKHANIKVTYYRSDSEIIEENYQIPPHGQVRLEMTKELKEFSCKNAIWVTVKSDNPFVKAWYFEFNESGIMGGDHSF
jgi:hypothetical protein